MARCGPAEERCVLRGVLGGSVETGAIGPVGAVDGESSGGVRKRFVRAIIDGSGVLESWCRRGRAPSGPW